MGWTWFDKSGCVLNKRGQIDRKATMTKEIETYGDKVIKAAMAGTTYYAVMQSKRDGEYTLLVCLTGVNNSPYTYENFGYKDMADYMGPNVADCPKSILDLADRLCPPTNEWARKWRERCRENLAIKNSPTSFKNVSYGESVVWHVPKDSYIRMGDIALAGSDVVLTKVKGYRSWIHHGMWNTKVPTKYVNPADCELVA